MPRKPSLNHQMYKRMEKMKCIGESKHQAKQEYKAMCQGKGEKWNPAKTVGIHSTTTYEAYKQTSKEFIKYIRSEHRSIKDINHVTRNHAEEYLKLRDEEGKSPYTISKDMSALNKLFNFNIKKADIGLRERSYKEITRSRTEKDHDHKYNPENYREQINFAKAFGSRRESIVGGQYQVKDVSLFKCEGKVYASLIEKGGRYRESQCLEKYQKEIEQRYDIQEREPMYKEQFIHLYKRSDNLLFDKYTTKIDNHAFRAEYAQNRYRELLEGKENKQDYRGYDNETILQVSKDLGHNRPSVVVEHYLK